MFPESKVKWVAMACLSTAASAIAGPVDDAMNADRAFARMAQENGVAEAFGKYAAPNAIRFVPGAPEHGPSDIQASVAKEFIDGSHLNWEPKEGEASADGSQVVVWGRWTYNGTASSNLELHGTYLTVWVRQADGAWRYSHDIGNADPRPKAH